jgi:hypothetical protein
MLASFTAIQKRTMRVLAGSLAVVALAITPLAAQAAELLIGSTATNKLVSFSTNRPKRVKVTRLQGLAPNERVLGLDVRPLNGQLYALGSTSQIYLVDPDNGQALPVGGSFTPPLHGDFFGFDFNPTVDRIRIISDANQNLRVNPDTGAVASVDTDLGYGLGDSGFGQDPGAVGAAYTNNDNDPATGTTLYDIDATRDVLVVQNPPNDGTLLTVGSLGVITDGSLVVGFDVAGSDGTAYAVLNTANNKRSMLYAIDLATGAATLIGEIGGREPLTSLATLGPQ